MNLYVIGCMKDEIKQLLEYGFIRSIRYVEWISNIMLILKKKRKKNGKLRVSIDFINFKITTCNDEYDFRNIN